MGETRILELVGEHVGEAGAHRSGDVGAIAEQLAELDHQVAAVEVAGLAQDAIVARVEIGEFDLAPAPLALGRARGAALRGDRPITQRRRRDRLGLQQVHPTQQPSEQARRVAADLVAAQRQLVEVVEHDREPVGRADRGEERVEARLERVVAQQSLAGLARRCGSRAPRGGGRAAPRRDREDRTARPASGSGRARLRADPASRERLEPQCERLGAAGSRRPEDEERAVAVLGHEPLSLGLRVTVLRHDPVSSMARDEHQSTRGSQPRPGSNRFG